MDQVTAKRKYKEHKRNAKKRGIEFLLTFEQWLAEWGNKIDKRGSRRHEYGMCRIMDRGAYVSGNVYIGTPKRNAHTRVIVNYEKDMVLAKEQYLAETIPEADEPQETAWIPDEMKRVNASWTWGYRK